MKLVQAILFSRQLFAAPPGTRSRIGYLIHVICEPWASSFNAKKDVTRSAVVTGAPAAALALWAMTRDSGGILTSQRFRSQSIGELPVEVSSGVPAINGTASRVKF